MKRSIIRITVYVGVSFLFAVWTDRGRVNHAFGAEDSATGETSINPSFLDAATTDTALYEFCHRSSLKKKDMKML
jgi:hypothetical protein